MRSYLIATILCIAAVSMRAYSQADTIRLSVEEAEKSFLQNNMSLLAGRYNIDVNNALVRQAKLWDNPVLTTDQNIYDSQGGFLKHDQVNGQVYVQIMQLIKTAGKRNKLAQLAVDNTTISIAQFDDLVRTLHYALISDLYEIEHQLKIKRVYDAEINELITLVKGMDEQLKSGNISVKDNIRIKALLFNLRNELVNIDASLFPVESEVRLLLHRNDTVFIAPAFTYHLPEVIKTDLPSREELIKIALDSRTDAKAIRSMLDYQVHNLAYQKALAKPDISIGTEYDQRSSYAPNYVGLAISLPINIFNKNQGNIASAQFGIKQQQAMLDAQLSKIENEITSSFDKIKFYQRVNNLQQLDFAQQYDAVFQNMLKSYQQRQVSLLEFIDFADAYKDTKLKLLEQHTGLIKSVIELNYLAGKDVIIINK